MIQLQNRKLIDTGKMEYVIGDQDWEIHRDEQGELWKTGKETEYFTLEIVALTDVLDLIQEMNALSMTEAETVAELLKEEEEQK